MAKAIQFYKNKNYDGFTGCEETIIFTEKINDIFDALNRKFPAEGIKKDSHDLEVFLCVKCCMCKLYCFCEIKREVAISKHK